MTLSTRLDTFSHVFIDNTIENCFGMRRGPCWLRRTALILFPISGPLLVILSFTCMILFLLMQIVSGILAAWECNHD